MKIYYVIKNNENRYLKVRTGSNGTKRAWVKESTGASVFTQNQAVSYKEEELKGSPFYDSLSIEPIGEAESAWMAKDNFVRNDKR